MIGIEGLAVMFGGPQSSRLLVGEGDGGLVVADAFGKGERSGAGAVERLLLLARELGAAQDGTRVVDEQHAQVGVTASGDASETARGTAGVFARREAEGAGEVAPGRETIEVADRGAEGGRGDHADPAGALQALGSQVRVGECLQALLDGRHRALGSRKSRPSSATTRVILCG